MSASVDVLAVLRRDSMDAAITRQYDSDAEKLAVDSEATIDAVAELIEAARKLRLDRVGIQNAAASDFKLVAPMLDLAAVLDFNAALARIGSAK